MIRQGHSYRVLGYGLCIALETTQVGFVRCLTDIQGAFPTVVHLPVYKLFPAPMRYFGGEVPA